MLQERFSLPWWKIPATWSPIKQWLFITTLNGALLLGVAPPICHRIGLERAVASTSSPPAIYSVVPISTIEESREAPAAKFSSLLQLLLHLIERHKLMLVDISELPLREERADQYGVRIDLRGTYQSALFCISKLFRVSPSIQMEDFSLRVMSEMDRSDDTLQLSISLFVKVVS